MGEGGASHRFYLAPPATLGACAVGEALMMRKTKVSSIDCSRNDATNADNRRKRMVTKTLSSTVYLD